MPTTKEKIFNGLAAAKEISRKVLAVVNVVGAVNLVGAVLLTVLLGSAAWSKTEKAETYRLATAALVIGLLLGWLFYYVWPCVLSFITDPSAKAWTAFAGLPVIMLIIVFFLNGSKRRLS